ncbi:hypothetical protein B0T17DRAFT_587798 [Bombardia bombarda]|uniref:Uncharacterized protein n=1 Tax=Bombardia bombarda TaxID=252184 RepID=A0AA39XMF2_9PEZI|nr:hypothetical protein B0T17DRAFT_587798 [Bombardia bombarda]
MSDCNGSNARMWLHTIPHLSFESDLVLNPMLALSALHLHSLSPDDLAMAVVLRRYIDRALLSAIMLSHNYWLLAHQPQPDEPYELPLLAFKMIEGLGSVFAQERDYLDELGYGWFGGEEAPPEIVYTEARDYVLCYYRAFCSGAPARNFWRFVGFMPARCQPGYRQMLQKHDPLAMALMARMLALLRGLAHTWWLNGQGEYEVVERDVRGICQLMDWPLSVLNKDIVLER